MIEPTDEMVRAAEEFVTPNCWQDDTRKAVAAVLTIVERDLDLIAPHPVPSCGVRGPDGLTCERQPHPHGELHGWVRPGELVQW